MRFRSGQMIGDYRILSPLGHGGMGMVYRVVDVRTGEEAALKTVLVAHSGLADRIRQEIRVLSRIHHPGVVRIRAEGVFEGLPWYAMDLLHGNTLKEWAVETYARTSPQTTGGVIGQNAVVSPGIHFDPTIPVGADESTIRLDRADTRTVQNERIGKAHSEEAACGDDDHRTLTHGSHDQVLPRPVSTQNMVSHTMLSARYLEAVITIMYRLFMTMASVHGDGIVHRDLKPGNIIVIDNRRPIVVDFGLTFRTMDDIKRESLVIEQGISGSISYMSPEQLLGEIVDSRSDLYSLGCIFYELVTGHPPYVGSSMNTVVMNHLYGELIQPIECLPTLPRAINDLIVGLLQKTPRDRLAFAETAAEHLLNSGICSLEREKPAVPLKPYLHRPGFLGRQSTMDNLTELLTKLENDEGGVTLLEGESGIGKTRCLMEYGRTAVMQGCLVLTGCANEQLRRPLDVLRQPLRAIVDYCQRGGQLSFDRIFGPRISILADYEPLLAELTAAKNNVESEHLPVKEAIQRLYHSLLDTLTALAETERVVMILDDVQWCDDLSLGFLSFLVRRRRQGRLRFLVLAACRSEETPPQLGSLIEDGTLPCEQLGRFQTSDIREIIADMLARTEPPALLTEHVSLISEGNPFFAVEYLYAALDEEILRRDTAGQWCLAIDGCTALLPASATPRHVLDLINRRLDRLGSLSLNILFKAAVLGKEMKRSLLFALSELPEETFLDVLSELEQRHVLETTRESTLIFSHDKIRDVVTKKIATDELMALHRGAAEKITLVFADELDEYAESVGKHWELAGDARQARPWYRRAAEHAVRVYDLGKAEHLLRAWLQSSEELTDEYFVVQSTLIMDVLVDTGKLEEARDLLRQTLAQAHHRDDSILVSRTLNRLGMVYWRLGETELSRTYYDEALENSQKNNQGPLFAETMHNKAALYLDTGRFDEARGLFEKALLMHRQERERGKIGRTLGNLALLHQLIGNLDQALELFHEALSINQELHNRRSEGIVLYNMAGLFFQQGDTQKASDHYERALAIAREILNRRSEGRILSNLAMIAVDEGRMEEASAMFQQALSIQHEYGDKGGEALTLSNLSELETKFGHWAQAEEYLRAAFVIESKLGNRVGEGEVLFSQAELAFLQQHYDESDRLGRAALETARQMGHRHLIARILVLLADVAAATRRSERAIPLFKESLEAARALANGPLEVEILIKILSFQRRTDVILVPDRDIFARLEQLPAVREDLDYAFQLACEEAFREIMIAPTSRAAFERAEMLFRRPTIRDALTSRQFKRLSQARDAADRGDFCRLHRGEKIDEDCRGQSGSKNNAR